MENKKIGTIIQARMSSHRLPGKVMLPIREKPMLFYVLNQIKNSRSISTHIVATSTLSNDDVIAEYAKSQNMFVFRGNHEDVLDRYYQCAKKYNLDIIVRISADSPLIDYTIIDKCVNKFLNNDFDYLSNTIQKIKGVWKENHNGFPIGFAVEVFTFKALEKMWHDSNLPDDREHVTEYIIHNPQFFKLGNLTNSTNLSHYRLVVDYKSDFEIVKKIILNFKEGELFTLNRIINKIRQNSRLYKKNE